MYAGDVTPDSAYEALATDPDAVLVDVRTQTELVYVGLPDLSGIGKRVVVVEWTTYPHGRRDDTFVDQLGEAGLDPSHPVYFLCRSGSRSRGAAIVATAAGYTQAYNVGSGFEGSVDEHGHRGNANGWKAAGLPWRQG